jgi:hypothetical protein
MPSHFGTSAFTVIAGDGNMIAHNIDFDRHSTGNG